MPIYEYKCQSCGERYEKLQKYSDPPCKKCPHCGGALKKLISSPAIQFKGSGFYITDYAKKNSPSEEKRIKADSAPKNAGESKPAEAKSAEAKAAPAKTEAKSETKTAPKTEVKSESKSDSKPAAKKSDS
jgi:putative FmdB family regulatory protein